MAYSVSVFKRSLPPNHTATWSAVLRGTDNAARPSVPAGAEACLTIAQGLSPGRHLLELRGSGLVEQVRAVRFYNPLDGGSPKEGASGH